jgi:hypothetical protein
MPEESIQPKADEQQAGAEEKHGNEAGQQVVIPPQPLPKAPEEIKNSAPPNNAAAQHNRQQLTTPRNWPPTWHLIAELCIALAIAYFAWGQVEMGRLQWDATEKQWNAMLEDQQPWIWIELPLVAPFVADKKIAITFRLKNDGRFPGKVVYERFKQIDFEPGTRNLYGSLSLTEDGFDLDLRIENLVNELRDGLPADVPHSRIIPPNAVVTLTPQHLPKLLSAANIEAIEKGEVVPVLVVLVIYQDTAANRWHQSYATFVYDRTPKQFTGYALYNDMK